MPVTPDAPDSVHLADWPVADEKAHRPGAVRADAAGASAGRAGPGEPGGVRGQDAAAAVPGADRRAGLRATSHPSLRAQITEELNVSSLASLSEVGGSLVDTSAKANFRALGKRFGKRGPGGGPGHRRSGRRGAVRGAAPGHRSGRGGRRDAGTLSPEEVIITETPARAGRWPPTRARRWRWTWRSPPSCGGPGLARDAIRLIQEARKNSRPGRGGPDRAALVRPPTTRSVARSEEHAGLIAEEVLATDFAADTADDSYGRAVRRRGTRADLPPPQGVPAARTRRWAGPSVARSRPNRRVDDACPDGLSVSCRPRR